MKEVREYNIEKRLIAFAVKVIKVTESLPKTTAGIHLSKQLCRSGISPALNYGEAQGAESVKDFIHKMRICLKELRESSVAIRIIQGYQNRENNDVVAISKECNELIAIFVTSIKTAQKRNIAQPS